MGLKELMVFLVGLSESQETQPNLELEVEKHKLQQAVEKTLTTADQLQRTARHATKNYHAYRQLMRRSFEDIEERLRRP